MADKETFGLIGALIGPCITGIFGVVVVVVGQRMSRTSSFALWEKEQMAKLIADSANLPGAGQKTSSGIAEAVIKPPKTKIERLELIVNSRWFRFIDLATSVWLYGYCFWGMVSLTSKPLPVTRSDLFLMGLYWSALTFRIGLAMTLYFALKYTKAFERFLALGQGTERLIDRIIDNQERLADKVDRLSIIQERMVDHLSPAEFRDTGGGI